MNRLLRELIDGDRGTIRVLLSSCSRGVTAKGAPYLSFTLQDKSGTMDAKYWNVSEELLDLYEPGMVVDAMGDVLSHNHQLQFRVKQMDIVEEDVSVYDFVQEGPIPADQMKREIEQTLSQIQNDTLSLIIQAVYERYGHDFFEYPAATRNHHDFVGGLATHTIGMLRLANAIADQYPMLNRDLLVSGTFLHDLGKIKEFSAPVVPSYTTPGKLLGHISIFQAELTKIASELGVEDSEEVLLLRHMILSHHGVHEYGSPVLPMIPEAEVLHLIDNLDARMNTIQKALDITEEGAFTQRIFALENRSFYKSTLSADEEG